MKKPLLILACCCVAFSGFAQSKITPAGLIALDQFRLTGRYVPPTTPSLDLSDTPRPFSAPSQNEGVTSLPAFVVLGDEGTADMLTDLGLEVNSVLGAVVVINLPLDRADEIAALPWVKQLDFGTMATPNLNYARQSGNVNTVQNGFSYNSSTVQFDGTGVICGMMDTGMDPNHVNFKDSNGEIRIKRLWHMNSDDGSSVVYTPATIPTFTTDDNETSHATHVAGIIGGGYRGDAYYIHVTSPSGGANETVQYMQSPGACPYYGVATGADLAFAVGQLYTPNIVYGVDSIINYAESVGKPVVVNLSLGHTTGPHDGSDAYGQALTYLGSKGIICMSAGNDGDEPISIVKTFGSTAASKYVLTSVGRMISANSGNVPNYALGAVDIWGSDDTPLTVKVGFVDANRNFTEYLAANTAGYNKTTSGADFTSKFNGSVQMTTQIDPNNNRYRCYLNFNNLSPKSLSTGENLAIYVEGKTGQTAYIYGSAYALFPTNSFKANIGGVRTSTAGNPNNSINDGACAANVLSVGAYVSRTSWATLDYKVFRYTGSFVVDQIAPFSAYGKAFDGTQLPLIAAPGANIISSYSSPYLAAYSDELETMCARATYNSRGFYWGTMQGTSMSCPFVTGTIGLWLQADPTLTYDKVIEVLRNSSTTDANTEIEPERWGYGRINGEAGMRYVLDNRASIGEVWDDDAQRLVVSRSEGLLDIFVAGETSLEVRIVDLQGRTVATATADGDRLVLSTDAIAPGVYIVHASGTTSNHTLKLTL